MEYKQEIAKNIEKHIKYSGKNQSQVAKELDVHRVVITDYITGKSTPSTLKLRRLCQVLECSYEEILGSVE